jgi:hypothetical protein
MGVLLYQESEYLEFVTKNMRILLLNTTDDFVKIISRLVIHRLFHIPHYTNRKLDETKRSPGFWSLPTLCFSTKNITFPKLDLFPSSTERVGRYLV